MSLSLLRAYVSFVTSIPVCFLNLSSFYWEKNPTICWVKPSQALDCVLARIGIGITIAGITEVPETLALKFPTEVSWLRSHTDASYDEVSSHHAKPKQPPPPGPAAHDRAPELALVLVSPVTLTKYFISSSSNLFLIICLPNNFGRSSIFWGAVLGSNHG